jgi:hypothetical protein
MNYYVNFFGGIGSNGFYIKWIFGTQDNWKIKILGTVLAWSYQLNSTANLAHLPRNRAKWAELALLFSWYLQNGPQDFDFSTAIGAKPSFYMKFIATYAPKKVYIISHS